MKIPEEHDLESQIRKEREWRFLRNTRVRKQAQQLIQKGKGRPQGSPRAVSRPPLALVRARNEAGGDAPGRKGCHHGAPLTCPGRPGPRALCAFVPKETWRLSGIIVQESSSLAASGTVVTSTFCHFQRERSKPSAGPGVHGGVACVLTMGMEDKHQALVVFVWTQPGPQIIVPYYPRPVYQSHFDQAFY